MYVCMYVYMYACMHACMHACMYVCMYVCVGQFGGACVFNWLPVGCLGGLVGHLGFPGAVLRVLGWPPWKFRIPAGVGAEPF